MNVQLVRSKIGSLDVATVQAEGEKPKVVVVLCHGFGAGGDDLVGIGAELLQAFPDAMKHVRFVFPEAPLSLEELGMYGARAWWMIDMARVNAMQRGDLSGMKRMREEIPAGLAPARQALRHVIDEVSRATGLPMGKFVLGGFSQGAMITTDLTLRLEEAPAALAIFSGTIISEPDWTKRANIRRGLRVVQSHGRQDPILPYAYAEDLRKLLTESGLEVTFTPFDGGHTIPGEALRKFADLVAGLAA